MIKRSPPPKKKSATEPSSCARTRSREQSQLTDQHHAVILPNAKKADVCREGQRGGVSGESPGHRQMLEALWCWQL